MAPLDWLFFLVGSAAVVAYVSWWYRTREDPVRGRRWAAGLRATALILALLILINPTVPGTVAGDTRRGGVLLDASLSMSRLASSARRSYWDVALDSVNGVSAVWLFGGEAPLYTDVDSLPRTPLFMTSRVDPAVRTAAATGVRELEVLTDGGITDLHKAEETARRLGVMLRFTRVADSTPGIGIAQIEAPRWATSGDTITVSLDIAAAGFGADSIVLQVSDEGGAVVAAGNFAVPAAGRLVSGRLAMKAPETPGYHRYRVRFRGEDVDAEPRDNERSFQLKVAERPTGPLLLSLHPDWEASFLLPNLDRLSDAPAAAYMQVADSLISLDQYRPLSRSLVAARARTAPLVVVHGYTAEAPAWVHELIRGARRVLVFPAGDRPVELPGWGVRVGAPEPGEWYVAAELPSSPVSGQLVGLTAEGAAPLLRVRAIAAADSWSPLLLQRSRRGVARPAVVAGAVGRRRWAVAAAEGYWRWAMRPDLGRGLYRALWTGIGGWLLGNETTSGGLDPVRWVVGRDESLRWDVPSVVDSLVVRIQSEDSSSVWNGVGEAGDTLAARLEPGLYRYEARAYREGAALQVARGPAEVEEFLQEVLPRDETLSVGTTTSGAGAESEIGVSRTGRGLARLGWPYLLLLGLFCTEWLVRRLNGLR